MRPARATHRVTALAALLTAALALAPTATAAPSPTGATAVSVRDVVTDPDGSRHTRYDTTYRQLPVIGGDFVVHSAPDGAYEGTDRAAPADIAVPTTTPRLAAPRAADLAAAVLREAHPGILLRGLVAKPRLVVDALHSGPRLAWRTTAAARDPLGNPTARTVLTDATTGARIDTWNSLETAAPGAAEGDGRSLYSGTVPLTTTRTGTGGYRLDDPTRGNTYTGDAENRTDTCVLGICLERAPAEVRTDADNHWGSGTTADRASAAVDAQYGTDRTWDYYKEVHGRIGIADDGKGSYNRVHYGKDYNNAFWDDNCFCMTYGDGDGTTLGPLVALDVTGHEMSHGVTSSTAALTYSGESGGLNEATSDVFGTLVEFHARNASDPGDWLIGEKIVKPGSDGADGTVPALRYMDRPSRDGKSADCWNPDVGRLDVHYSSGVANHFAYLLAEGSGPKTVGGVRHSSPTCDGSRLTGIGRAALGGIWYRALTVYMTSSTDYEGARSATLRAAKDLYGAGGEEYAAVAAAWSAVSVT
ncbi:M4 family metallopeptidase [Streptomyces sp. WG-D5]